jgi:hypothetical protein
MLWINGVEYGTADEIAIRLGGDVTTDMVRKWAARRLLPRVTVGRTVYLPYAEAATVERDVRLGGRGRPRRVDAALASAS